MAHPRNSSSVPPEAHRAVRSYVVRAGRTTPAQHRALTELWPRFGVDFRPVPLDLDSVFGRSATRMVEIGFGAGESLLSFASGHPEVDCLGIEVHPPGIGHLLLDAEARDVRNLRVIAHDAVDVLARQLPPASIDIVHIFFPDPWPKKRHHKRRLIQPHFVELLARVMVPRGVLRLATDWEHYAHHMREVLDASREFRSHADIGADIEADTEGRADGSAAGFVPRPPVRPLTRFERRGQRLGHGVWDLEYERAAHAR